MERCDILIVGGGPAGSTLAWKLRRDGRDVVVMDSSDFPRDKVCAGWITPAVVEALRLDLDDYAAGRVLQSIRGFRVGLMGGKTATVHREMPVSYGIRRCEFDHYLLRRCGARLRLGQAMTSMRRDGGDWVIDGQIRARLVVGAGGHFCPVARALGARPTNGRQAVLTREIEFEMTPGQQETCSVQPMIPELFFCDDLAGYGWVFRKGNYLNVGLGREDRREFLRHATEFREFLVEHGKVPGDLPDRFRGHAYYLYSSGPREVVGDGVMLIGDAAGLAYAESGEGIRPAVESALLAARAIATAGDSYRLDDLALYGDLLRRRFGERERRSRLARLLPARWVRSLAGRLLANEWFAGRVVVDRWFLRTRLPPLRSSSYRG